MTGPRDGSHPGAELAGHFREFAVTTARRAPLYAALSTIAADRPELTTVLDAAPDVQRRPVLLFAAVHRLLLDEPDDPLAAWYPNLTSDPAPPDAAADGPLAAAFEAFVSSHRDELHRLVATRSTQTNEVGRCGFLVPVLARVADEVGGPLALVDVGTSGGLTLVLDRYRYRYTYATGASPTVVTVGGPSPVVVPVDVRGDMPRPRELPTIGARLGLDRDPVDVTEPDDARWLEACVWPDQTDRFQRLVAAIGLFADVRPPIVRGDAVDDLEAAVERVAGAGHPVVVNTWVLSYLADVRRDAYLANLDRIGARRDLSWVWAEAPALVPELPTEPDPRDPQLTVLTLVRWRGGTRTVEPLATCHPHGYWIHWR